MATIGEMTIEQLQLALGYQPRYVGSIEALAKALGISKQTCLNMLATGKYNKAIHHLVGNCYRYNVDKIMELSRLK